MNRSRLLFCLTCTLFTISRVTAQQPVPNNTNTFANLSGMISYGNEFATPLSNISIQLSASGIIVDTTVTDSNGYYAFDSLEPDTYNLHVLNEISWGGVNAIDALLVLKHFTGLTQLNPMQLLAADVDASGYVNSTDALLIARRFTGIISSFPAGDWVFETATLSIPQPGNYQQNLQGLCTGDLNTSFLPGYNAFQVCGDTFTDLRNGKKYPTVQIGNQCWFAKNLNIGNIVNFPDSASGCNNGIIEKYCLFELENQCDEWGAIYNWVEIMQFSSSPYNQGICPQGFYVPAVEDWEELLEYAGGDSIAGGKLKTTGFTHWKAPNTGATNELGFNALGSGGITGTQKLYALFASSSESSSIFAYGLELNYTSNYGWITDYPKDSWYPAFVVRCIKN